MSINAELQIDRKLARQMPRAWPAFFSGFGRLTSVQREAIPSILAGDDVLLCSATASGKTEAVCAPLIERNIDRANHWKILYISPTRALVNDLYERLIGPLSGLGLSVNRRTGDHRDTFGERSGVVITTPESMDSLLCRGRLSDGHVLAAVAAVVLDEIHLLYGSPRGEQVRWLLERLRRMKKQAVREGWCQNETFQCVGLSATLSNPDQVKNLFMPLGQTIVVNGGREIEVVDSDDLMVEDALPAYLRGLKTSEKILVFSGSRRRVDELTESLRNPLEEHGYAVRAHHGSLSKEGREEAEEMARSSGAIVLFATSTLEIGIDIGDIDLVVLDDPAPDVSDLLQRIGRGNRRKGKTRVITCASSPGNELIHEAMLKAAMDGWMGNDQPGPQHAVARQQVASYLFQSSTKTRQRNQVESLLRICSGSIMERNLLDFMIKNTELIQDGPRLKLGSTWLNRTGRGDIHSTIEDSGGAIVIDEKSGERIAVGVKYHSGSGLHTGGKNLRVVKAEENRIRVRQTKGHLADGEWSYASQHGGRIHGQAQCVRYYLGLGPLEWLVLNEGGETMVFHLGGLRRKTVLELMASSISVKERPSVNDFFMVFHHSINEKPDWLLRNGPGILGFAIVDKIDTLEYKMGRPFANRSLPLDLRLDEMRGWLQLEKEVRDIQQAAWIEVKDKGLREILLKLY